MEENYLHHLWKSKRFDNSNLKLTDGREIEIVNVGWHNNDAGPDFFNGTIKIDGITWTGNIELHVLSSDWYAHKHQHDGAYNNVVLHVVHEHDKEIIVQGRILPTLELKGRIDHEHYNNYEKLTITQNSKPCQNVLEDLMDSLSQQIQLSFFQRVERKGLEIISVAKSQRLNQYEVFLYCIAQAMGGRLNKNPMQELCTKLPLLIVWKEKWNEDRVKALVFGIAGFLDDVETGYQMSLKKQWVLLKRKYSLDSMRRSSWKFKGVRPHSFPTRKLAEFSEIILKLTPGFLSFQNLDQINSLCLSIFNFKLDPFWKNHLTFSKATKNEQKLMISQTTKNRIKINAFAPYLIYRKHLFSEYNNDEVILELFETIPTENNIVIKQWRALGVESNNAIDSQGLLELNNEFCIFRKCLNCQVGKSILEHKKLVCQD